MDLKDLKAELIFLSNELLSKEALDANFMTFVHFESYEGACSGRCYFFSSVVKAKVLDFFVRKADRKAKYNIYDIEFDGVNDMLEYTEDRIFKWDKTEHQFCIHRERIEDSIFPDVGPIEVVEFT